MGVGGREQLWVGPASRSRRGQSLTGCPRIRVGDGVEPTQAQSLSGRTLEPAWMEQAEDQ